MDRAAGLNGGPFGLDARAKLEYVGGSMSSDGRRRLRKN
jgi:hypothetical protein